MKQSLFLAAAGCVFVASAAAQHNLGTFTNTGTTFATRGAAAAANTNPVTLFTRHGKDHYAGWTDGSTPFTRQIVGMNFVLQDQNLATAQNFNLVVYQEDPAMPNFPDVVNNVTISSGGPNNGQFVLPAGTGGGAWNASANFATPVSVPAGVDIYVGLQINSPWTISNNQVTDGLSIWEIHASSPTSPQTGQAWDVAGSGLPTGSATNPVDRFSGYYVPSPLTGPAYPVQTQFKIQPIIPISGGVAGAVTNQVDHPESNSGSTAGFTVQLPGAGTAVMFSGLHPDASNPPFGAGRIDDISMMFRNDNIAAGSPVFFLIDIGGFGPEIPAANFVPGSTGVSCLNFGTMQNLGFVGLQVYGTAPFTSQRAFRVTTFPAAARPLLNGIDWLQQAVALDLGTNTIHASACTRQRT